MGQHQAEHRDVVGCLQSAGTPLVCTEGRRDAIRDQQLSEGPEGSWYSLFLGALGNRMLESHVGRKLWVFLAQLLIKQEYTKKSAQDHSRKVLGISKMTPQLLWTSRAQSPTQQLSPAAAAALVCCGGEAAKGEGN